MDSIDDGATIRIGFRKFESGIDDVTSDFRIPTYSLKINKKTVLIASGQTFDDDMEIYRKAAVKIGELMKAKGVKNYVIYNGERVRMSNHKWESCGYVPVDIEAVFTKTLEDSLN